MIVDSHLGIITYKRYRSSREDFGLEVYFDVLRDESFVSQVPSSGWKSPGRVILSYIKLPSIIPTTKLGYSQRTVCILSSIIIDPSTVRELSSEQKAVFNIATATLLSYR